MTDRNAVGYHLGLAKLRRDGYVSLDAHREREGMLATQPFIAGGDRLIMNAACGPDGYIKVEAAGRLGKCSRRQRPGRLRYLLR